MRIIDFLQLISDLDKQTQFFYSDADKNLWAISPSPIAFILRQKKQSNMRSTNGS